MRRRATAIVVSHHRVLLVKERRAHSYSLPGGGVDRTDDSSRSAVIREIREETALRVVEKPEFLFHHRTFATRHSVYLVRHVTGNIRLQRKELRDYKWWDRKSAVRLSGSTQDILGRWRERTET